MRDVGETLGNDKGGKKNVGKILNNIEKMMRDIGQHWENIKGGTKKYDPIWTIEMDNEMLQDKWKESCKRIGNEENGERARDGERTMWEYTIEMKNKCWRVNKHMREKKKVQKKLMQKMVWKEVIMYTNIIMKCNEHD